jgi:hypothetical protein
VWVLLALILIALALPGAATRAAAQTPSPACPAPAREGPHRYVIFVHGLNSSSLTALEPGALDPGNHKVRDDFQPLRETLAAGLAPAPRFIYFSYGAATQLAAGTPPESAWEGSRHLDEGEPRYWAWETTNYPVQVHADALGWLIRDLLRCDPAAVLDVVAYSLGGLVALRWAADEPAVPGSPLLAVHRLVLLDSPVGGMHPVVLAFAGEAAPPEIRAFMGDGTVLRDLSQDNPAVRAHGDAQDKVDVGAVENAQNLLVNGAPLPLLLPDGTPAWLGRGAARAFPALASSPAVLYADLGSELSPGTSLLDAIILAHGTALTDPRALQHVLDLVRDDGPIWQQRRGAPGAR